MVNLAVVTLLGEHFRSHIFWGAAERESECVFLHFGPGEAEVSQFDVPLLVNENVLGFNVTVDDIILMQMMDCKTDFCEVDPGFGLGHPFDFSELLEELSAWTILNTEADPFSGLKCTE